MKKILFGFLALLLSVVSVNAAVGSNVTNIAIDEVKVTIPESIGYNEELEVEYSITPSDATNLNLDWSITGIKTGVSVEIVNSETNSKSGIVTISINNTTDKEVTLNLYAKQDGYTLSKTELKVETKDVTIERVTGEVEKLIINLDEKINKKNYDANKEALEEIEDALNNNEEIEELISKDLLTKYNNVKDTMTTYEENQGKTFTIVISIILVAIFVTGMFLIFKKEEK